MEGGTVVKTGMDTVWTALNENVTPALLGAELKNAIPFIAATALFAFGFYLIRRAVKKATRGKAGI